MMKLYDFNNFKFYYLIFLTSLITISLTTDLMQCKPLILFLVNPSQILEELENTAFRTDNEECEESFFGKNLNLTTTGNCKNLNNCNGNGDCVNGQCKCYQGWTNYDCSVSKNKFKFRFMPKFLFE